MSNSGSATVTLYAQSKNVDTANSGEYWWFGQGTWSATMASSTTAQYVYFNNCCRIDTLKEGNNGQTDQHAVMITLLSPNGKTRTQGISSTGFPRESVMIGTQWGYSTPGVNGNLDGQDQSMVFAVSPTSGSYSSYLRRAIPCTVISGASYSVSCPNGLSYNSITGVASLVPAYAGPYAFSVSIAVPTTSMPLSATISSTDILSTTNAYTWVQLDFIILVVAKCVIGVDTNCNHAPYFLDGTSWIVPCYATVPADHTFIVADVDAGNTLELQNTPVPDGFTMSTTTWKLSDNTPRGQWIWSWWPQIDDVDVQVCLKAVDNNGLSSSGTTCPLFTIVLPPYMYVSGVLRVFPADQASAYGFASTTELSSNPFQSTLSSTTRKPVYKSIATIDQSHFDTWWTDSASTVFSTYLYTTTFIQYWNQDKDSSGVTRVYSYRNTTFWAADDAQSVTKGTNRYFTYEVHTSFDYLGTETLNFATAGDLWVFMNNALMLTMMNNQKNTTATITNAQMASAGMTAGETYNVDVFYAHRSANVDPVWQAEWANSTKCSAITLLAQSGANIPYNIQFTPTTGKSWNAANIVGSSNVVVSANQLTLLTEANSATSSSAWFSLTTDGVKQASALKLLSGFQTTFTFNMKKITNGGINMEGLAFVMQSQSPTARGGDGASLGYSGLSNSVAIEFDTRWSYTYDGSVTDQHISLHTAYNGTNSAIESSKYWPLGSQPAMDLDRLPFSFDNGTDHVIRIEFLPSTVYSFLYVYVNDNIRPLYTAQLDSTKLGAMFQNGAYVGFTTGVSDSTSVGTVVIKNWQLLLIPPDAGYTGPTPQGTTTWTTIAGSQVNVDIQLRDACDQPLLVSGESRMFTASMKYKYSDVAADTIPVTITDLSNGIYRFSAVPTRTDTYTLSLQLTTTAGTNYVNSRPNGFDITVLPSDNVAATSAFSFSAIRPNPNNVADSVYFKIVSGSSVACVAFDQSGVVQMGQQLTTASDLSSYISSTSALNLACAFYGTDAQISSATSMLSVVSGSTTGLTAGASFAWVSTRTSTSGSWTTSVASSLIDYAVLSKSVVGSSDTVAVYIESAQSKRKARGMIVIEPSALSVPTVSSGSFWIYPRDRFNNTVYSTTAAQTYSFSPDLGASVAQEDCVPAVTGQPVLTCVFTTGKSGSFLVNTYSNTVPIPQFGQSSAAAGRLLVTAGAASYATSQQSGITITASVDVSTSFIVTLYDADNNRVLTQPTPEINNVTFIDTTNSSRTFTLTSYTQNIVWSQSSESYTISYTSTLAGIFYVKVYVNGKEMLSSTGLTVAINPGVPSPLSYVAQLDQDTDTFSSAPAAGTQLSYVIQARDKYGNACTTLDSSKYVFAVSVTGTNAPSSVTVDSSSLGSGRARFSLTPTTVASWTVTVTITTPTVTTATTITKNVAGTQAAVIQITPVPGDISALSIFAILCSNVACSSSISFVAGVPIPFELDLIDAYGNNITATQTAAAISSALTLNLQTSSTSTYALIIEFDSGLSQMTTNSNRYRGTMTATVASGYVLSLILSSNSQTLVISNPINSSNQVALTVTPASTDMPSVQSRSAYPSAIPTADTTTFYLIDVDMYGNLRANLTQSFSLQTSGLTSPELTSTCTSTDAASATYSCDLVLDNSIDPKSFTLVTTAASSYSSNGATFSTAMTSYRGASALYARIESVIYTNRNSRTVSLVNADNSSNMTLPSFYSGEELRIVVAAYDLPSFSNKPDISTIPSLTLTAQGSSIWTATSAPAVDAGDRLTYTFAVTLNKLTSDSTTSYSFVIKLGSTITSTVNVNSDSSIVAYSPTVVPGDLSASRSRYLTSDGSATAFTHVAGTSVTISILPYDVNGNAIYDGSSLKTYVASTTRVTGITSSINTATPSFTCSFVPPQIICVVDPAESNSLNNVNLFNTLFNSKGAASIALVYNNVAISSRFLSMTTTPGPQNLLLSTLNVIASVNVASSLTSPWVVKEPKLVYLIAVDSFGNGITDLSGLASSAVVSSPDTSIVVGSWVAQTNNIFAANVTFSTISRNGVRLTFGTSSSAQTLYLTAYVRSAAPAGVTDLTTPSAPASTAWGLFNTSGTIMSSTITAGIDDSFNFIFKIQDPNGQPFLYDLTSSTGDRSALKITTSLTTNGIVNYVTSSVTSFAVGTPGVWGFSLDQTALTKIGVYTMVVSVSYGSTLVNIGVYQITVQAGNPYLPRTTFSQLPSFVVGETASFSYWLYDRVGNLITTKVTSVTPQIRSNLINNCAEWHHADIDTDYPVAPSQNISLSNLQLNTTTGTWTFDVLPKLTNSYTIYLMPDAGLSVNSNNTLSCSQMVVLGFTVGTGHSDAYHSVYTIQSSAVLPTVINPANSLSTIIVGQTYYIFVQLKDNFGNLLTSSDVSSSQLVAFMSSELDSDSALVDQSTANITKQINYQDLGYSNGVWSIQFQALKTYARADFAVFLQNVAGDFNRINGTNSNNVMSPQTVYVQHAAPVSIRFVSLPSVLNFTAGQTLDFVAECYDNLGNLVDDNSLHYVRVVVLRDGTSFSSTANSTSLASYYISPSSPTSSVGVSTFSFTPAWEGIYAITATVYNKQTAKYIAEQTISIDVTPATCAQEYIATHPFATVDDIPRYRCQSTGECVKAYSACSATVDQTTCATGYTRCSASSTTCVPYAQCPATAVRCDDGTYVASASLCPVITPCPSSQIQCPTNKAQCRSILADCPSEVACSPGLIVCPNQLTCATDVSACPVITTAARQSCASTFVNGVICPDGSCVSSSSDCGTSTTCPSGQVLCLTDNSCRANATMCPSPQQYNDIQTAAICTANDQVLCWDSSCASSTASCPSRVTCPVGKVLCPDNQCRSSQAQCTAIAALDNELDSSTTSLACPIDNFRCDDGSCVMNKLLCPSIPSCSAAAPVLCADYSCKASLALCTVAATCSSDAPIRCPSTGQCVTSTALCTTAKTCPAATPTLCASTRTCVADIADCAASTTCPSSLPYACPSSGACRASLADCPSTFSCPNSAPMKCPDGSCQVDLNLCTSFVSTTDEEDTTTSSSSASACDATKYISCPTGECIPKSMTLLGCPTHVTCPVGSSLCVDGTCRTDCSKIVSYSCTAQGLVSCPLSGAGQACAASLTQCPRGITCPLKTPVKCFDASCAATLDSCPVLPTSNPPSSKIPCPDSSWVYDTCPTAVTCPASTPYTCYDQTCKTSLDQCPTPTPCDPTSATPYRCATGSCVSTPWDCGSIDGTVCNTEPKLVKCPLVNSQSTCVADSATCPTSTSSSGSSGSGSSSNSTGDAAYTSTCPAGFYYCRDGSCAETSTNCPQYTCPLSYPYLCSDGSCSSNSTTCPATNGCPWDTPVKCPGVGTCVARLRNCPAPTCAASEKACPDGSCSASCLYTASGCTSSQTRCADGTCVSASSQCTSQANNDYANSCLPGAPYKCSSGLCVGTRADCPTLDNSVCSISKPVLCADGLCRESLDLCPIIKPCLDSETRCGNGECRASSAECPTADTCPGTEFRCKQANFASISILDGICSNSNGQCFASNGCPVTNPLSAPYRCDNGRCVSSASQCNVNIRLANGCVTNSTWTNPVKCWNGECAQSASVCPATNGCPAATPFRCSNGDCLANSTSCPVTTDPSSGATTPATCAGYTCADGSCATNPFECKTSFGCPVATPVRCADGSCKKYSAAYRHPSFGLTNAQINAWTCQPTIYCTSDSYSMCEDGQCVLSTSQCSSVSYSCSTSQIRCLDGTCSDSYEHCGMVQETDSDGNVVTDSDGNAVWVGSSAAIAKCPSSAPAICSDGSCVTSLPDCSTNTDPSRTTINGSPSASQKNSSSVIAQVLCFDGSYRNSYQQCVAFSKLIFANNTSSGDGSSSSDDDECVDYCSNGACVPVGATASVVCDPIPACDVDHYRCHDGTCRTSCLIADAAEIATTSTTTLSLQDDLDYDWDSSDDDIAVLATDDGEVVAPECEDGQILCTDGVCRTLGECPTFYGCGFETQFRYRCASRECSTNFDSCATSANRDADSYAKMLLRDTEVDQKQSSSATAQAIQPLITTSFSAQPNALIHLFAVAATTTTYKSCSSNCITSQSITATSVVYDATREKAAYSLGPLSTGFAVTMSSGIHVNSSQDTSVYFSPVPESVYFNASNKVTYSRVGSFGSALTAAQTVLSPVFSCYAGEGLTQPFAAAMSVTSLFDRSGSQKAAPADVCLARLRRYPEHNYATWECLFNDTLRSSGNTQYTIRQTSTAPLNQATSYITTCIDPDLSSSSNSSMSTLATDSTSQSAVYAFIHSPIQTGQVYAQPATSWWDGNVIWVIIVAILAVLALFSLVYAVSRLSRYQSKTEQVKEEIKVMEREVDDLENYGGRRYDGGEVAYTANPMAQSLEAQQELQKMSDADRLDLQKKRLAEQQQESAERQEVIQQLEDANAQELAMLEATRAKLQQNQRRRAD